MIHYSRYNKDWPSLTIFSQEKPTFMLGGQSWDSSGGSATVVELVRSSTDWWRGGRGQLDRDGFDNAQAFYPSAPVCRWSNGDNSPCAFLKRGCRTGTAASAATSATQKTKNSARRAPPLSAGARSWKYPCRWRCAGKMSGPRSPLAIWLYMAVLLDCAGLITTVITWLITTCGRYSYGFNGLLTNV